MKGNVSPDHVHLMLSMPPQVSPSRIMQGRQGKEQSSSDEGIQDRSSGAGPCGHEGTLCVTTGNVTDEVIKQYIEQQGVEPQDDRPFYEGRPLVDIVKLTGFRGNKPPYRVFRRGFTTDILGLFQLVMR